MKAIKENGKWYLPIERVEYGQPGQPEESREYHFLERKFPVGFLKDFIPIVKDLQKDNPELEGIIVIDPVEMEQKKVKI